MTRTGNASGPRYGEPDLCQGRARAPAAGFRRRRRRRTRRAFPDTTMGLLWPRTDKAAADVAGVGKISAGLAVSWGCEL